MLRLGPHESALCLGDLTIPKDAVVGLSQAIHRGVIHMTLHGPDITLPLHEVEPGLWCHLREVWQVPATTPWERGEGFPIEHPWVGRTLGWGLWGCIAVVAVAVGVYMPDPYIVAALMLLLLAGTSPLTSRLWINREGLRIGTPWSELHSWHEIKAVAWEGESRRQRLLVYSEAGHFRVVLRSGFRQSVEFLLRDRGGLSLHQGALRSVKARYTKVMRPVRVMWSVAVALMSLVLVFHPAQRLPTFGVWLAFLGLTGLHWGLLARVQGRTTASVLWLGIFAGGTFWAGVNALLWFVSLT